MAGWSEEFWDRSWVIGDANGAKAPNTKPQRPPAIRTPDGMPRTRSSGSLPQLRISERLKQRPNSISYGRDALPRVRAPAMPQLPPTIRTPDGMPRTRSSGSLPRLRVSERLTQRPNLISHGRDALPRVRAPARPQRPPSQLPRWMLSRTFMAALRPGTPLTAPPRRAPEPQVKTFL